MKTFRPHFLYNYLYSVTIDSVVTEQKLTPIRISIILTVYHFISVEKTPILVYGEFITTERAVMIL